LKAKETDQVEINTVDGKLFQCEVKDLENKDHFVLISKDSENILIPYEQVHHVTVRKK
jgi:sporulation protein YlmC with PRC-barrel domain